MSFLSHLPLIGRLFDTADKAIALASEAVTDKDKQNELIAHIEEIKVGAAYIEELRTKTIPWMDGLHKMSRITLSLTCIAATVLLMLLGHEITPTVALILGGPSTAYTIIKGRGK